MNRDQAAVREVETYLQAASNALAYVPDSRETSLVQLKIDEADLWLSQVDVEEESGPMMADPAEGACSVPGCPCNANQEEQTEGTDEDETMVEITIQVPLSHLQPPVQFSVPSAETLMNLDTIISGLGALDTRYAEDQLIR